MIFAPHWKSYCRATAGLVLLVLTSLLTVTAVVAADQNTAPQLIRVVMDNNYPPYVFQDNQGQLQGIIVDQWRLWEKKTGVRVELTGMDWAEAQRRMQAGNFDVIDTMFRNEQRELLYDFTKPYATIPVPLFFHADISGIRGVKDLQGFMVAAKAGGNVLNVLRDNGITSIVEYPSYEKIVAAARDGQVKVFTVDRPPALYYLHKMGIQHQFRETKPLYNGQFHRAVNKGNRELLSLLESGFAAITAEEYQEIDSKWRGSSLDGGPNWKFLAALAGGAVAIIITLTIWNIALKRGVARRTSELATERARLQTVLHAIPDLVWIKDVAGVYLGCNHRFERFFGAKEADVVGKTDYDFVPAEQADFFRAHDRLAIAAGKPSVNEEWILFADDGHTELLETIKTPVKDGTGQIIGVLGIARDITAQRAAVEKLRSQAELLDLTHDAIIVRDMDDRITFWNRGAVEQYGWSPDEAVGQVTHTLLQTSFPSSLPEIQKSFSRTGRWDGELQHVTRAGTQIDVVSRWVLQRDEQGAALAILEINNDVTEKHQLEVQMLHTQKLESLGVLAGGIAHDFNNILTAVIGNVDLAQRRLGPESPVTENLRRIKNAAVRAADLAKQMLAYSGKGQFVVAPIDLNRLVEEMGHMLEVSISKKVVLRYNFMRPLPIINADASQLSQIVMNLVINATEAIGEQNGIVTIATGFQECDEQYLTDVWLVDPIPPGLYVYLEITDNGCGMDRETLASIFDPFFTTKFTGRGLGMSAVLGIVRGHKGAIKIDSEPGRGSTFRVLLPATSAMEMLVVPDSADDGWRGSGVALLVDDEATVRDIGSEMLRELGFTVITAGDGQEALVQFKARPDTRLVILDLTMPRLDGGQCFSELRRLDPKVRVIMASGFDENEVAQKFVGKGLVGFLQKPYTLAMLRKTIQQTTSLAE
jgi:PAS domain S-box-containing protein